MPFLVLVMLFEFIRNFFKKEEDLNLKAKNKTEDDYGFNQNTQENESNQYFFN